jgi:hypothetical protein
MIKKIEPGRTTFWMIGSRVAASLFATVCMYATASLVDVLAILKTHVSLSGCLPLWYLDLWNENVFWVKRK